MEAIAVERSIWIKAPRERAWQAITDPAQLEEWYAEGCPWEIPALQPGATLKFFNSDTDVLSGTILTVDQPHQFVIRWRPDPSLPEAALDNSYLLSQENGGTRFTLTQTGYESVPEDARQSWVDADAGAFSAIVESLKAYLERA